MSDSNVSVQWIVNYFRDITNKLPSGGYPSNKFYVATVITNFKHYASAGKKILTGACSYCCSCTVPELNNALVLPIVKPSVANTPVTLLVKRIYVLLLGAWLPLVILKCN